VVESRGFLRSRGFLSYFGMNVTSRTAGAVANVAIIWLVFAATQSPLAVATIGVAETLASIGMTLPAGVWIDRYDRRTLLLLSNAVRAASLGTLALVTAFYGFQFVAVIAAAVVWNAATELYRSTDYSVLPELVEKEEVADANGVTRAGYSLVGSVSNALGGALVAAAGATLAFGYGFATYSLAAVFSFFLLYAAVLKQRPSREESPKSRRMGSEVKEGFRWLIKQPGLLQLSVSALVFNFLFGMANIFMVVYVGVALNGGAFLFGIVLAAYVIGNATGSLMVGRTRALGYAGKVWILVYGLGVGLLTLFLGAFPTVPVAILASLAIGLAIGFSGNVWLTSAQSLVPTAMRGRYFAIDGLLSFIGGPPSIAVGGILITIIGVTSVYQLVGVLMMASAVGFVLMKSLWVLDGRVKD
jgi:MFS family permease